MALEDFTTTDYTTFYWYNNASGRMNSSDTSIDFGTGEENTRKIIEIWNKNGTGAGSYEGATQDNRDIWKHIQEEHSKGWYIPSRGEWGAFADYFTNKTNLETKLTTRNYNSLYGLSDYYWSSSQCDATTFGAWSGCFGSGYIDNFGNVQRNHSVRLGATF